MLRVEVGERAPHHLADQFVLVQRSLRGDEHRAHCRAVADDCHIVCDGGDLVEFVADDDARHALLVAQLAHQVEQVGGVLVVECGGRLVEDQQFDVLGQRLGDFHELLLAHANVHDLGVRVLRQTHALKQLGRLGARLVPVDHAALRLFIADEDVLGDGEERAERELLMDDDDTVGLGILDGAVLALLAVEGDGARIRAMRVDARKHIHQCGLACAVLAADGMYLAAFHRQIDAGERFDRAEGLDDVVHRQNRVVVCHDDLFPLRSAVRQRMASPLVSLSKRSCVRYFALTRSSRFSTVMFCGSSSLEAHRRCCC